MPRTAKPAEVTCALCERTVRRANKHHIVPRSEGGEATVWLCLTCHATLHKFFSNRTLADHLNSIEALRSDPDIARYLVWVRKQSDQAFPVRRRKNRL